MLEHRHVVDRVTIEQLVRDLAAEGITISDTAIRRKIKPSMAERAAGVVNLRDLAAAKVSADRAVAVVEEQIAELPETRQIIVRDLAERMVSITTHLSCAAEASADTARKLALLARAQADRIDISKPMNDKTRDTVSAISAITRTANEAGSIGMGLIAAHRVGLPGANAKGSDDVADLTPEELDAELRANGIDPATV